MEEVKDIDYEKWLAMTVDSLHQALDKFNVGKLDGELWKSIMGEAVKTGDMVESIIIRFKQYGRFVDMGAGRGRTGTRKHRTWYSKTKTREIGRLRELLIINLSKKAIGEVEGGFNKEQIINIQQ